MTVPSWLAPLVERLPSLTAAELHRFVPPPSGGRHSAVLVLFGEGPSGPDVLLIERARTMRSHAGQPAFPGGALDPEDGDPAGRGPVVAALREAREEVGLDPDSVTVLGALPAVFLPPSGFVVHPVVGWWHSPHAVAPVDAGEVATVARVPVAELVDPENRLQVSHPSGWLGPAFDVGGLLVWGFTAGLLDRLLAVGGWERPWDTSRTRPLDDETVRLAVRGATFPSGRPAPSPLERS